MSDFEPSTSWARWIARLRRKLEEIGWNDHWDLRLLALVMAILVWLFVRLKTP